MHACSFYQYCWSSIVHVFAVTDCPAQSFPQARIYRRFIIDDSHCLSHFVMLLVGLCLSSPNLFVFGKQEFDGSDLILRSCSGDSSRPSRFLLILQTTHCLYENESGCTDGSFNCDFIYQKRQFGPYLIQPQKKKKSPFDRLFCNIRYLDIAQPPSPLPARNILNKCAITSSVNCVRSGWSMSCLATVPDDERLVMMTVFLGSAHICRKSSREKPHSMSGVDASTTCTTQNGRS